MRLDAYRCETCGNIQLVESGKRPGGYGHHTYVDERRWVLIGAVLLDEIRISQGDSK